MKRRIYASILGAVMIIGMLSGCTSNEGIDDSTDNAKGPADADSENYTDTEQVNETVIILSDRGVEVNGAEAKEEKAAVYISNDIIYYEDKDTYDSGNPYGEGEKNERHSKEEAEAHTVVNITEPGVFRLKGTLPMGQVRVDLGENAKTNPAAVVTLVLDDVDITCEAAPAILFVNVYECDNEWSRETASADVDTTAAGANIVIADGTENVITGSHVAKIFKDSTEEKKLWKQDGAVYSYMSMNVDGGGTLNLTADNEGMDTELHLTINGGNINIRAQNDGINTNEDGVSVTTINGGNLHIIAGLGEEGDGIDSNGWLVINGGTVIATANPAADAGLDSDMGSFINGGVVAAFGSTMDWAESDSEQVTVNLQFSEYKNSDDAVVLKNEKDSVIFAYDPSEDEVIGTNIRKYMGAIISSPEFSVGDTYSVWTGGTVTGDETSGLYDTQTVQSYEGGMQQEYTGTDVMMRPGGFGGQHPEMPEGERPEMPEDRNGQLPEGMENFKPNADNGMMQRPDGERPDGWNGERPEKPEGEIFEDAEMPGGRFPEMMTGVDGEGQSLFYMQDKVNFFSGVRDMEESDTNGETR